MWTFCFRASKIVLQLSHFFRTKEHVETPLGCMVLVALPWIIFNISQGRRSLRWLDVTEKVLFNDLVLAFKCVNGLAPDYLGKYFVKRSAVHNKNTRGCNNFVVPRCRLSMGQRAFYFRCPREWNGLADNIKNTKEIGSFKRTLFKNMFHTKWFWIYFEQFWIYFEFD